MLRFPVCRAHRPPRIMMHVGTCGYSYSDWKGPFYPPTLRPSEMLGYYARAFTAVEIDSTYYRVPPRTTFAAMAARVPAGFRFAVKLPGSATHGEGGVHPDVHALRRSIEPLGEAGLLAAVLMQFPHRLRPSRAARETVEALHDALDDIPLAAEFRNADWQTSETLDWLRDLGIAWVNVDMPQFPTLMRPGADVTAPLAYVRFHGRNTHTWWRGTNVTRYDYEYGADELGPWADRLVDLAANADVRDVLAFFNNHRRGQAARNATMFTAMLRTRFPERVVAEPPSAPPAQQLALGFED